MNNLFQTTYDNLLKIFVKPDYLYKKGLPMDIDKSLFFKGIDVKDELYFNFNLGSYTDVYIVKTFNSQKGNYIVLNDNKPVIVCIIPKLEGMKMYELINLLKSIIYKIVNYLYEQIGSPMNSLLKFAPTIMTYKLLCDYYGSPLDPKLLISHGDRLNEKQLEETLKPTVSDLFDYQLVLQLNEGGK